MSKSLARPEVGERLVKQSADYHHGIEKIVGYAALVEQAAAAASSLQEQSGTLVQPVAVFAAD
ncbi:hypothetical protein [Paraburkholderia youngii]|uniref:hypothetical protein n=1 Tax=Paraburkholderia youngii TaxID=2782701 RepID=UPI003D1AC31C